MCISWSISWLVEMSSAFSAKSIIIWSWSWMWRKPTASFTRRLSINISRHVVAYFTIPNRCLAHLSYLFPHANRATCLTLVGHGPVSVMIAQWKWIRWTHRTSNAFVALGIIKSAICENDGRRVPIAYHESELFLCPIQSWFFASMWKRRRRRNNLRMKINAFC